MQVDNDRVIVTEWRFAPGAEPAGTATATTTWWCRPPTANCASSPARQFTAPLVANKAYARQLGVEHNVINNTDHGWVFIGSNCAESCPWTPDFPLTPLNDRAC